jgi:branched-subunit amino acid ABC-type transport system permease component
MTKSDKAFIALIALLLVGWVALLASATFWEPTELKGLLMFGTLILVLAVLGRFSKRSKGPAG